MGWPLSPGLPFLCCLSKRREARAGSGGGKWRVARPLPTRASAAEGPAGAAVLATAGARALPFLTFIPNNSPLAWRPGYGRLPAKPRAPTRCASRPGARQPTDSSPSHIVAQPQAKAAGRPGGRRETARPPAERIAGAPPSSSWRPPSCCRLPPPASLGPMHAVSLCCVTIGPPIPFGGGQERNACPPFAAPALASHTPPPFLPPRPSYPALPNPGRTAT